MLGYWSTAMAYSLIHFKLPKVEEHGDSQGVMSSLQVRYTDHLARPGSVLCI